MAFAHYIRSGQKRLRCGYTTGTCAALAAAGAARFLLTGIAPELVRLQTPKGIPVEVPLTDASCDGKTARGAVEKDAGDDADITGGLRIYAAVSRTDAPGIAIDGGEGVGRVTKPGLDQPPGAAAINRVPRQMIAAAVKAECAAAGYGGGMQVVISIPGGGAAARKTFNPGLGIEGGLSILGTSGIVEPMSEQAIVDTIAAAQRQAAASSAKHIVLTPGNYGLDFLRSRTDLQAVPWVKCSNFIGDALDIAAVEGFASVLLAGHIGKLVKLAGGVMNTHSKYADCRLELFCAHAALCGADTETCRTLIQCATADGAVRVLDRAGLRQVVLASLLDAIQRHLERRAGGAFQVGAIVFSNEYGVLGQTKTVEEIIRLWNKESFTASASDRETRNC
ncbi:MAG: cobalamin biosynthesis protein CbiD [Oscillibacter sp.]|jgi:cobalt-precorrin-5B (C1)-methyltransferase|nr:cobalamin biosynthesis protein CbiD [Oscillibacter sp.]